MCLPDFSLNWVIRSSQPRRATQLKIQASSAWAGTADCGKITDLAGSRPEAKNLVAIYAALADTTREAVLAEFGGQGFGAFKPKLAELAVTSMAPVTAEMRRLMADPAEIDRALAVGAERAREVAQPVVDEVKKIVGFWQG